MKNIRDIERMTLYEYEIRKTACQIDTLNRRREIHEQAWANHNVQATKKAGNKEVPYFKNFRQFFDYEKQFNEIMGIEKTSRVKKDKVLTELLNSSNL